MQSDKKTMKIAQLIPQFYRRIGGAEICIHNVCKALSENGHEAVVITSTAPPENPPVLPYQIEYLWPKTCGLFRRLPHVVGNTYLRYSLARLQRKHNFDLWQVTNGWPLGVFAVDFFKKNNIPCVLRCCGEDIQTFPQINYGVRLNKSVDRLIKEKFPLFDAFVSLTPSVKEEYFKLGIPDEKIRIIPNGTDTAKFAKLSDEKRSDIRKKIGVVKLDSPLILTVGRYHPKKGFDSIPHIAKSLKERGIDFNWIIAGRNVCEIRRKYPYSESVGIFFLEKFATTGGQEVFNLPSQELIDIYCASDIFALPTLIETFGMVLVEAMAAGLPIITTDAPGVRDVINDGAEGFKVEAGNSDKFAEKLAVVIKDERTAEKFSAQSRASSKAYDWKIVAQKYLDFYQDLKNKT